MTAEAGEYMLPQSVHLDLGCGSGAGGGGRLGLWGVCVGGGGLVEEGQMKEGRKGMVNGNTG